MKRYKTFGEQSDHLEFIKMVEEGYRLKTIQEEQERKESSMTI